MDRRHRPARRLRDRLVLRRQHDHAGDLGPVGRGRPDHGQSGDGQICHSARHRHPRRPVRHPEPRNGQGRADVRADHAHLFPGARRAGRDAHHGASGGALRNAEPVECGPVLPLPAASGFYRHGLGGARRDRRRGALCRHGPFRPQSDPRLLARIRASRAAAQLHGAGGNAAVAGSGAGSGDSQEPILLSCAGNVPPAAGFAGDGRDDHRQPGGDLGRLLGDAAGHPW